MLWRMFVFQGKLRNPERDRDFVGEREVLKATVIE